MRTWWKHRELRQDLSKVALHRTLHRLPVSLRYGCDVLTLYIRRFVPSFSVYHVCPEPVLANDRVLRQNGAKKAFHLCTYHSWVLWIQEQAVHDYRKKALRSQQ